ncbi:MAG: UDP-glucose/GDP-mannose dehydrogenase family protein [Anaerolineae bacterium]|jgi:UDPglucose 6-dehydrogenase
MKNMAVVGVGYVGLVTGACLSDLGNRVVCVDINDEKIEKLNRGEMPIYEPGLEDLVERNVRADRLSFTTSYAEGLEDAEFVFIAVGTPEGVDGEADLRYVRMAARSIAEVMDHPMVIVNKATVPVGTGDWVADLIRQYRNGDIDFAVVSNPEFLREGSAIRDFLQPDRVVLGSLDRGAAEKVAQLYLPLRTTIMITDLRTAEMIKYASNAFLATRISFINEIANICEALGADVKEVATGMGYDARIGHDYLDAGVGYGGSCFPKDVKALTYMAEIKGRHPQLLRAVMEINDDQRRQVVRQLDQGLGGLRDKTIGLLGLAFKPNTDDMREAPAAHIARMLMSAGAHVRGYDPVAEPVARRMLPEVELSRNAYDLAEGCDALVVVTDWNEFKNLDLFRIRDVMSGDVLIDGRNIYEPEQMKKLGFHYRGIGRGYEAP